VTHDACAIPEAAVSHPTAESELIATQARPARLPFKAQLIYLELHRKISDLVLAPGSILDRVAIARAHFVSRTPVGEAIAKLVAERLVEVRHYGSVVAPISASHVREALFIRMALEVETCRRAATMMTPAAIERLRANLDDQRAALEHRNYVLLFDLDEMLHTMLFDTVACPRAKRMVAAAVAAIARIRRLRPPTSDRLHQAFAEHGWIVDAMATKNPDFAAAAMRAHLGNDAADIERSLQDILAHDHGAQSHSTSGRD
jgi:GntR family transcriptional regulator, rspAB operon transcriptional repressor